jgi:hypothetical protein
MSAQTHQVYEMPCPPTDANRVENDVVSSILARNSPRLNGEDKQHIKMLAETAKPLPPILVHRGTMRVIDGMYRLRVAHSLGWRDIQAVFFDGTEEEACFHAVKANTEHGLPLTLAGREAATARIKNSAFQGPAKGRSTLRQSLQKDPPLRLTETGRKLPRWLDCRGADSGELGSLLNSIPLHCIHGRRSGPEIYGGLA